MTEKRTQAEWDYIWLGVAGYFARKASKDPSTKCGSIIVRPDQTVASFGYNGFPRKLPDHQEHYLDRKKKLSRVIHAELNAILTLKDSAKDGTLYIWPLPPCDRCAVHIIQAGIIRVVSLAPTPAQVERWGTALDEAAEIFKESGVELVTYPAEIIE